MFKNQILLIGFLFISLFSFGQDTSEQKYALTARESLYGFNVLQLTDPYLSPLNYTGIGFSVDNTKRKFLKSTDTNISELIQSNLQIGLTVNPQGTAAMMYGAARTGWGLFYHFKITNQFRVLTGGIVDGEFAMKYLDRNVNNPVNFDVNLNINAAVELRYDFNILRKKVRLSYALESPFLGLMYVPVSGASYYEMFELGNLSNTLHFSSLHNKLAYRSKINFQYPFKNSTLLMSLVSDSRIYEANDMVFNYRNMNFMIGFRLNTISFSGTKNVAPENFLTTDN